MSELKERFAICKPGDIVFVECKQALNQRQMDVLCSQMRDASAKFGIKIVVLPHQVEVARLDGA